MPRTSIILLIGLLGIVPCWSTDGPGLPNVDWQAEGRSTWDLLARIDSSLGVHSGSGFVMMHRGYLLAPFSNDGGGGDGSGGFAFIDLSDPTAPTKIFSTEDDSAYSDPEGEHYAGNLGEAHGYSISGDIWCARGNRGGETGLMFWDLSDPTAPVKIGTFPLEGMSGGDYGSTPWWICWQGGRYVYVAGTNQGLYIVDASDPADCRLVDRLPTGDTGNFRINTCFAIGNLLVIARSDGAGIATFDISDPGAPQPLDDIDAEVGYSMMVNGGRIYGAHDPARWYDISDPTAIGEAVLGPDLASKGGYGSIQDGTFCYGSSSEVVVLDITGAAPTEIGTHKPSGFSGADWDFLTPLGNLGYCSNDHNGAESALVVLSDSPDRTGPSVNMVVPADGATAQALTSRVGLTFTDSIDLATVDTTTIQLRAQGGEPVAGRFSHQTGIVNFWPDEELLPGTTYEVVVPAGGCADWAGNTVPTAFSSSFTTAGEPEPTVTITAPTEGATVGPEVTVTFLITGWVIEPGDSHFHWHLDGSDQGPRYSTDPIELSGLDPGPHSIRITLQHGDHSPAGYEDSVTFVVAAEDQRIVRIGAGDEAGGIETDLRAEQDAGEVYRDSALEHLIEGLDRQQDTVIGSAVGIDANG